MKSDKEKKGFEDLLEDLEDCDEGIREQAILALAKTGRFRAISVLQKVVSQDESVKIRYVAKKALQYMKKHLGEATKRQGPRVIAGLEADKLELDKFRGILFGDDAKKKQSLLELIVRHDLSGVGGLLIEAAALEENPQIRSKMVLVLGIIGGDDYTKHIATHLYDEDPRVRANAIEALEHIGSDSALSIVVNALSDEDNRIRANAVKALRNHGSVNIEKTLRKMLQSNHIWMRDSAAFALGMMGREEFLPLLEQALEDEEASVQQHARNGLELLARRGSEKARTLLEESNMDEEPERLAPSVWSDLAQMLQVSGLKRPIESSHAASRLTELRGITSRRDLSRIAEVESMAVDDDDSYIRALAVSSLGSLGKTSSIKSLILALNDQNDRVRANAIEALGLFLKKLPAGESKAASLIQERIAPFLKDGKRGRCRANAVIALADSGASDIGQVLRDMVEHGDLNMKKSALFALSDLNRAEFLPLLRKLSKDEDEALSGEAQELLRLLKKKE